MKRILFITLMAAGFSDLFIHFFNHFFDLPQEIFAPLGRWVMGFQKGHFYVDNINTVASYPHESLIGFIVHLGTALIFAYTFLLLLRYFLGFEHDLRDGMLYGSILMLIPLLIEMPAMGLGYFGMNIANQGLVLTRLAGVHIIFGLGMGLSNELYTLLFVKKKT
jgi:Protein of unknown function (DUF2938)